MKAVVAIPIGDPAGIGPEIVVKALAENDISAQIDPILIGSVQFVKRAMDITHINMEINTIDDPSDAVYRSGSINVIDLQPPDANPINFGEVSVSAGKMAVESVTLAGTLALEKKVDAIACAPLNKEAMRLAGYNYEGQTQLLANLAGVTEFGMILIAGRLRAYMLTNHMSLKEACEKVTYKRVKSAISLVDRSLKELGFSRPRIAVAGLNPHCGENGLFGSEEINEINPAIADCAREGIDTSGPFPPDTVFVRAKNGEFDVVIAMSHDQANVPLKMIGFGDIVTLVLGLPFVRTSVGHGTAFDIAGKNIANHGNMKNAIIAAGELGLLKRGVR